jgi:hypothetical protein
MLGEDDTLMTCGYLPGGWDRCHTVVAMANERLCIRAVEVRGGRWELAGGGGLSLFNDYLGYVADRGYSPRTVRAYAFDLLHFARWLTADGASVDAVDTMSFCVTCPPTAPSAGTANTRT